MIHVLIYDLGDLVDLGSQIYICPGVSGRGVEQHCLLEIIDLWTFGYVHK